jgi:serine/threonine protein kinase
MLSPKTSTRTTNSPLIVLKRQARDSWKSHFSFQDALTVGYGISGRVLEINRSLVIKAFSQDEEGQRALKCERTVYEKLQRSGFISHCIVTYEEEWESGLVLERLEGTLRLHLAGLSYPPHPLLSKRWATETCQGLTHLHDNDILHGDIGCHNILINAVGHVKLCDFAGSKIGEEDGWVCYEVRSQHPLHRGEQPTIETELFALGSALFEICTSLPPYAKESNVIVRQKYTKGEFPLVGIEGLGFRQIVEGCWRGTYNNVSEVSTALERDLN